MIALFKRKVKSPASKSEIQSESEIRRQMEDKLIQYELNRARHKGVESAAIYTGTNIPSLDNIVVTDVSDDENAF